MDAFYASVEQRDNPDLQGKPVAVGGGGRRGVVASASYEARQFGVRSAMPGFMALDRCPHIIFVRSRFDVYREVSNQIRDIFLEYTDLVEPLSLDEAYLDVTQNKKDLSNHFEIAEEIRNRIFETTRLTASAGVSFNKFLAKIASDVNKPNGIKAIPREEAMDFIAGLPVRKFHGIGKVTAAKMERQGIYTGADLRSYSEIELTRLFGKVGRYYYRIVRAQDDRPVNPSRIRKSIGAERTFSEDIGAIDIMKEKLTGICERVFQYMQKSDNFGRTITVKIKSADFKISTRSKTFQKEVRRLEDMVNTVHTLLDNNQDQISKVRLLGVSVSNLEKEQKEEGIQLEFDFDHSNDS